jgi:endoglucanase
MNSIIRSAHTVVAALVFGVSLCASHAAYMRGVNLAGAEFGANTLPGTIGQSHTYNSQASFTYFGNKGLTLIRIPVLWERLQPTLNGGLDSVNLNALKQDITWASNAGCKVVIDIHNYARRKLNEGGTWNEYIIDVSYGGTVKVPRAAFGDLWRRLSIEFKNNATVYAYGLMNEPHDMGGANWKTISQAGLTAIRNNADNKLVLVSGDGWSGAGTWSQNNGPTSWISDPGNNFKYEAHTYFDQNNSGTYSMTYAQELAADPNLPTRGQTRLANFVNWCNANGVQGFLGEYGVPNSDSRWWTVVLNNFLTSLDAAGFDGTYWAGGEWWGSYPLSVQPANNFTTDAPQLVTLLAHLGSSGGGGSGGTGLLGEYFDNSNFTGTKVTRIDATVNFDWGGGSPVAGIGADTFSVRWSGSVQSLYSQTYTFYTTSDDGVRLWVNGVQVINNWTDHGPTENSGTISLTANQKYSITMEYYENGGGAVAKLSWSSASQPKQIIPQTQLFPVQSGAIYRLTPKLVSTRAVQARGAGTADGTQAEIFDWSAGNHQKWRATDVGGGYYKLTVQHITSKVLDVNGAASADGTKIQIWQDNSSTAQKWRIVDMGGGFFKLQPQCAAGSCLDLQTSGTANGTIVQLYGDNGTDAQRWKLEKQ